TTTTAARNSSSVLSSDTDEGHAVSSKVSPGNPSTNVAHADALRRELMVELGRPPIDLFFMARVCQADVTCLGCCLRAVSLWSCMPPDCSPTDNCQGTLTIMT